MLLICFENDRMYGVSLRDRVPSVELRARIGVELIRDAYRRGEIGWDGLGMWMKRYSRMEVEKNRPSGRPRKTWTKTSEDDMRRCAMSSGDANYRSLWRGRIRGAKRPIRVDLNIP
jgi:hypothetical protein